MSISRRHQTEEGPSSDDEENTNEDFQPKLRMLEFYIVVQNRRLEELIADHEPHSTIDLSCQKLTDRDMATILKYAVLEKECQSLNLWGNQFTFESISILSNILNGNRTIRELDLSHNRLLDKGVEIISDVLSLNTCVIKEIDLSSNGLTDQGAEYLANMLRKNRKLKALVLNKNDITNHGLILLAKALVNENKKLKQLKLESNPFITRDGVIHALNLLKNNQILEEIYVKDCTIPDEDFDMLENMSFTTGFDIFVSKKISIFE